MSENNRNKKMKTGHSSLLSSENSDYDSILKSLISPHSLNDFLSNYWEKKPLVIHRAGSGLPSLQLEKCFSRSVLEALVSKEKLQYTKDLHACRCVNGKTEDLNKKGRVTLKDILHLFQTKGATIQFHQPQRFVDTLWNALEKLECYFGCLVGSNVYITPKGTQGLAPHYDDVEVFIYQLEGEKHWRLYEAPVKLAREYKKDLPLSSISAPTHEFILKEGDVLYMPRGTVHQADSPINSSGHSTHITISTYQRHSWSDYLMSTLPGILEKSTAKSIKLREGLPLNFLAKRNVEKCFLTNILDELKKGLEDQLPAPTTLIEDFMSSRLPPFGLDQSSLEETPEGIPPTITSSVRLSHPRHIAFCLTEILPGMFDEDDCDEENFTESDEKEKHVLFYTSLSNSRDSHMISQQKESLIEATGILKFPSSYIHPLEQLLANEDIFVPVKELQLDSDADKIQFVTALWTQHILSIS